MKFPLGPVTSDPPVLIGFPATGTKASVAPSSEGPSGSASNTARRHFSGSALNSGSLSLVSRQASSVRPPSVGNV